jgi:hypothetical protein
MKLYDNAIYLNNSLDDETKRLLKLARNLLEPLCEYTNIQFSYNNDEDYAAFADSIFCDILDEIDYFEEIRV